MTTNDEMTHDPAVIREAWEADTGDLPRLGDVASPGRADDVEALRAEVERLRRWKAEALPVIDGLQELGATLGVGIGQRITGPEALAAAVALKARADAAEPAGVEPTIIGRPSDDQMRAYLAGEYGPPSPEAVAILTARAERAEAERDEALAKVAAVEAKRDEFADLLARALPAVAALARVEALGDNNPDHADTCGSMLTPGAGYPCSCWQAELRAALAVTTGEGECSNCRQPLTAEPCSEPDGSGGKVTGHWVAGGPSEAPR